MFSTACALHAHTPHTEFLPIFILSFSFFILFLYFFRSLGGGTDPPAALLPLGRFEEVAPDEVAQIIPSVLAKHCQLNAAPTWLIKQLVIVLFQVIVNMENVSFECGRFPEIHKQVIARPILKKPPMEGPMGYQVLSSCVKLELHVENS